MIYSSFSNQETYIAGKTLPPPDVANFTTITNVISNGVLLSWDPVDDLDLKAYVIQCGTSTEWDGNPEIFRGLTTEFLHTPETVPLSSKYLIRAVDTLDNLSINFTMSSFSVGKPEWDGSQEIAHSIEGSTSTLAWPIPSSKSYNIAGYQVKYAAGNSVDFEWSTATYAGGSSDTNYISNTSLIEEVTWGSAGRTFGVKAIDTAGNVSSTEIVFTVVISKPSNDFDISHEFVANSEGTSAEAVLSWNPLEVGMITLATVHYHWLPIDYYIVEYEDYKGAAPVYNELSTTSVSGVLRNTSFSQEVSWGPSRTNDSGFITLSSGNSDDTRRYWVTPVDTAGNVGDPKDYDVLVDRPNAPGNLEASDYHTKASNGVVDITWDLPIMTSAPITSIKVYWEKPEVLVDTNEITSDLKNSKGGTATKYSTPITWGPTATGENYRAIYFVSTDSAGNLSLPTLILIAVHNPKSVESLVSSVIDNNIILSWTDPAAEIQYLPVSSFNLYRCPAEGTCTEASYRTSAQLVSNLGGAHTYTFFETAAGDYTYFIETIDTAGNWSTGQMLTAAVSEPRDFVLLNEVFSKFDPSALTTGYCSGHFLDSDASDLNDRPFVVGTGHQVVGGSQQYTDNGREDENIRSVETDAYGNQTVVWRAINKGIGDTEHGDGGFNSNYYNIDNSKTYRFSYWINSKHSATTGTRYAGLDVFNNASGSRQTIPRYSSVSSTTDNAYFWTGDVEDSDTWYLVVGFIYGTGVTVSSRDVDHGVYRTDGTKVTNAGYDFQFLSDSSRVKVRGYQYYNPDSTTSTNVGADDEVWFMPPRMDDISDALCPTIADLMHARQYTDANAEILCEDNSGDWIESSEAYWDNIVTLSDTQALAPIDATHTWEQHFDNTQHGNWDSIQDQIDAGFEFYVVPEGTAHYWQKWDMGLELPSALIRYLETHEDYRSTHQNVSPEIDYIPTVYYTNSETIFDSESSVTDTTGWSSGNTNEASVLANDFRYVKIHIEYNSSSNSFRKIISQKVNLGLSTIRDDSKQEVLITEDDADTGVEVLFNKTFRDINSIIITPKYIAGSCLLGDGTTRDYSITNSSDCTSAGGTFRVGNILNNQNTAIYDFVDVANPTSFRVYLLDANSGAFSDGKFTWQVTGV